VPPPPNQTPAARFALIIEALCRAIAARSARHRLAGPILLLLWSRLRRTAARFARLAARIDAGLPPVARHRPAAPRPPRVRPKPRLPEGFAWVVRLVPEAACSASQLQHLLEDPQVAALIEAAPPMGRLLRPLCRMLGVRPPPGLTPPPPPVRCAPSRPHALPSVRRRPPGRGRPSRGPAARRKPPGERTARTHARDVPNAERKSAQHSGNATASPPCEVSLYFASMSRPVSRIVAIT